MSDTGAEELEAKILELVDRRGRDKTICPSEVARDVACEGSFRELMGPVGGAADRLAQRGAIVVTQGGREVGAVEARGPIRLGRRD